MCRLPAHFFLTSVQCLQTPHGFLDPAVGWINQTLLGFKQRPQQTLSRDEGPNGTLLGSLNIKVPQTSLSTLFNWVRRTLKTRRQKYNEEPNLEPAGTSPSGSTDRLLRLLLTFLQAPRTPPPSSSCGHERNGYPFLGKMYSRHLNLVSLECCQPLVFTFGFTGNRRYPSKEGRKKQWRYLLTVSKLRNNREHAQVFTLAFVDHAPELQRSSILS